MPSSRSRSWTEIFLACFSIMILSQVCLADGPYDKFPEKAPKVGKTAPDFTLKTLDGETFKLSGAYAKGPVVIEFGSFT